MPPDPVVSTDELQRATDWVDGTIERIRDVHAQGIPLDVEMISMLMLANIAEAHTDDKLVVCQQALMLSICLQRLA
jgi:hypothetical protein